MRDLRKALDPPPWFAVEKNNRLTRRVLEELLWNALDELHLLCHGRKVFSKYFIDTTVSRNNSAFYTLRCLALIKTAVLNTVLYAKL